MTAPPSIVNSTHSQLNGRYRWEARSLLRASFMSSGLSTQFVFMRVHVVRCVHCSVRRNNFGQKSRKRTFSTSLFRLLSVSNKRDPKREQTVCQRNYQALPLAEAYVVHFGAENQKVLAWVPTATGGFKVRGERQDALGWLYTVKLYICRHL